MEQAKRIRIRVTAYTEVYVVTMMSDVVYAANGVGCNCYLIYIATSDGHCGHIKACSVTAIDKTVTTSVRVKVWV